MAALNLQVIGCGDAFGSGGNHYACFFVQKGKCNLLLDCGASALVALKKYDIAVDELDYVLISHLHGDHFGGLPFLMLDTLQNKRYKELHIIGPKGIEGKTRQLFELLYPGTIRNIQMDLFVFSEYQSETVFSTADFGVFPLPVIHTAETLPHGLRINFGEKILSYSGDSSWCDNLLRLAEGADLFICECCFYDQDVKGHLSYTELLKHQHELQARLLLTHFDNSMLIAIENVKFECATEGMILTI